MSQQLIASKCTRCKRELTDPVSIACGIGPECRKKMGIDTADIERDERLRNLCSEANVLTFKGDYLNALVAINGILLLGYSQIHDAMIAAVKKIAKRNMPEHIRIEFVDRHIYVYPAYRKEALASWRKMKMRWNKEEKRYEAHLDDIDPRDLLPILREFYQGILTMGAKGVFWPGIHEAPVRHGQDGFEGIVDGKPKLTESAYLIPA